MVKIEYSYYKELPTQLRNHPFIRNPRTQLETIHLLQQTTKYLRIIPKQFQFTAHMLLKPLTIQLDLLSKLHMLLLGLQFQYNQT